MRLATLRKPSPRARRLGGTLASLPGCEHMIRGKAGLDDEASG